MGTMVHPKPCEASCQGLHGIEVVIAVPLTIPSDTRQHLRYLCLPHVGGSAGDHYSPLLAGLLCRKQKIKTHYKQKHHGTEVPA